ncbi:MAG TPA: Rho termination factor N-terminal domain-containing protein, partial [Candidatus Ozemobacteraceae bacterium]|nr:Rho termination factor N-terminal domain-containing protein [Candidatus Ozemobacteraceae bacterium]
MERGQKARDLKKMSRDELYKLAQKFNIKGRSALTKEQLIEQLGPFVASDVAVDAPVEKKDDEAVSTPVQATANKRGSRKNTGADIAESGNQRGRRNGKASAAVEMAGGSTSVQKPVQRLMPGYEDSARPKQVINRPIPDSARPGED